MDKGKVLILIITVGLVIIAHKYSIDSNSDRIKVLEEYHDEQQA